MDLGDRAGTSQGLQPAVSDTRVQPRVVAELDVDTARTRGRPMAPGLPIRGRSAATSKCRPARAVRAAWLT